MVGVRRLECATLRVKDKQASVDFCTDLMGLVEMHEEGGTTYLGCGMDTNFDLALKAGETGIDSVTFRMTAEEFDHHLTNLEERDIEVKSRNVPGHERNAYFQVPYSEITMGLAVVKDVRYHHAAGATHFLDSTAPIATERSPIAPLDLDHIGLISPDIEKEARFLESTLDFKTSDAKTMNGKWDLAFMRYGDHHHDISYFGYDPANQHHHLAWALPDMNQMKLFADRLAQRGHQLEVGFVRHGPGANISIYFQEPSGHRYEYATEVSTLDVNTPEGIYDHTRRPPEEGISLWGGLEPPESFSKGT